MRRGLDAHKEGTLLGHKQKYMKDQQPVIDPYTSLTIFFFPNKMLAHSPIYLRDLHFPPGLMPPYVGRLYAGGRESHETWLVANSLGGGRPQAMAIAGQQQGRGLVPWVGVAARLDIQPRKQQLDCRGSGGPKQRQGSTSSLIEPRSSGYNEPHPERCLKGQARIMPPWM
jgi:hypothetical protein